MAFYPLNNLSQTITVTGSSVATALTEVSNQVPGGMNVTYEVQNAGSATIFLAWGASTISTATTTGYPVLAGQSKVIDIPNNVASSKVTHFAFISGTTGQTVFITPGYGQ